MKLKELKATVFELSGVSTTKQLKAKYEEIKGLDMRRKDSWEKAFKIIQKHQDEFKNWLENPPDEYKELFAEIETVSKEYNKELIEAKQLGKEVTLVADSLEELAEEYQDEADHLKYEIQAGRRISKQAELN